MTKEERHIAVLNRMLENMDVYDSIQPTTRRKNAIKAAIKALEQQPVIITNNVEYSRIICQLPPVTSQQKYGKWIIIDDCEQFIAKCSECGRIEDSRMISKYLYCHCGAKMQEGEGECIARKECRR